MILYVNNSNAKFQLNSSDLYTGGGEGLIFLPNLGTIGENFYLKSFFSEKMWSETQNFPRCVVYFMRGKILCWKPKTEKKNTQAF